MVPRRALMNLGGNMVVSPGEPTILASVGQFPLLREFRERSPRPSNTEHTVELLALAARAAWVRGDAAALTRAGRRLFRLAGAGAVARDVLALGDLAASRLGPPPAGMTLPWARDPALSLPPRLDRKSTRLNSSHPSISYAVFCLKKKKKKKKNSLTIQKTNNIK